MILVVQGGQSSDATEKLRSAGFAIATSADGLQAFEQIHQTRPDLIFLDCATADEAIEVCRRLKENMAAREIPMIFCASTAERSKVFAALQSGASDLRPRLWALRRF